MAYTTVPEDLQPYFQPRDEQGRMIALLAARDTQALILLFTRCGVLPGRLLFELLVGNIRRIERDSRFSAKLVVRDVAVHRNLA